MKRKFSILAVIILMATSTLSSCRFGGGIGDIRDRNLEQATISRFDAIANIEYVGMSDVHETDEGCSAILSQKVCLNKT